MVGRIYTNTTPKKRVEQTGHKNNFLKKDIGFLHVVRNIIWRPKKWFGNELKEWIKKFNPDCVFFHNSNSIFILKMAYTICTEFNLPLIMEISDDYYFSKKKFPLLFHTINYICYKKMLEKMLSYSTGCIYISERMAKKYSVFNNSNSTHIHIASDFIGNYLDSTRNNSFCYFGNTGLNRYKTLIAFSKKLKEINNRINVDLYCPKLGNSEEKKIKKCNAINYCGSLKYEELIKKIQEYEYIIIAESFDNKTANYIKYSLSTKVSDTLYLGKKIIYIGNENSGTIQYLKNNKCGLGILNKKRLSNFKFEELERFDWETAIKNSKKRFDIDFDMNKNKEKSSILIKKSVKLFKEKKYEKI